MLQRGYIWLIGWLLHYANMDPPSAGREEFYALKTRLLYRYGHWTGWDVQHIRKVCYRCEGKGCHRCFNGVWDERWIRLARYRLTRWEFHIPQGKDVVPPETLPAPNEGQVIEGYITHHWPTRLPQECAYWLFLLCGEWQVFWQVYTSFRPIQPEFYPLVWVQGWFIAWLWELRSLCGKRCRCGRRVLRVDSRRHFWAAVCTQCAPARSWLEEEWSPRQRAAVSTDEDDLPF